MQRGFHGPNADLLVCEAGSGYGRIVGVNLEEVVDDYEEHGEGAKEDGEGVEG